MKSKLILSFLSIAALSMATAIADDTLSYADNGASNPVDPDTIFSSYGSTQTARGATDARLKALARALNYDPDRIYEYVHNYIEFTPTFGLSKGAVGAMLDEAGTAYDQAELMVHLLRIDNPDIAGDQSTPAKYKTGTISLNGTEFDKWFGVTNAKAACQILGAGGFPAKVNGSTNCSSLSGSVTSVVIAHVWVEATTSGGTRYFDPARKDYLQIAGLSLTALKTAIGYSASTFNTTASATTGTTSGVTWAHSINYSGIESYLTARAGAFVDKLKDDYPDAALENIIGGQKIIPVYGDDLGWASLPADYTNVAEGWHGTSDQIPDDYRIEITIDVAGCDVRVSGSYSCNITDAQCDAPTPGTTSACDDFRHVTFADQLGGKRLMLGSMQAGAGYLASEGNAAVHLFIDGDSVAYLNRFLEQGDSWCDTGASGGIGNYMPAGGPVGVKISADMPYASQSGAYMDRSYETSAEVDEPAVLIAEFGDRRTGKGYDSISEQHREWVYPHFVALFYSEWENINPATFPGSYLPRVGSDKQRATMVKSYFDQFAQISNIVQNLFDARAQHHYSLGLAWSRTQTALAYRGDEGGPPGPHPCQEQVLDAATSLDVVPGVSVTALNGDTDDSKRYAHLYISSGAMLEASVGEQATDSPVVINTQSRFKWASEQLTNEKFYLVTPSNFATADSLDLVADEAHVGLYTNNGYSVLVPASNGLGPGPEKGVKYWSSCTLPNGGCTAYYKDSLYRGGAMVAFDSSTGAAAYLVQAGDDYNGDKLLKGGGVTEEYDEFDPTKLPDVMEEDYGLRAGLVDGVSLQNGELTYQPAPDLVTGSGSFPYSLAFQRKFKAGQSRSRGLEHGWTHNWDMRANFGGDGLEALGASNPQNAAAAIAALIAADSILDATWDARRLLALQIIEDWQRTKMAYNTVTLVQGNDTIRFFRLPDGTFNPPAGQAGTLSQTGTRAHYYPSGGSGDCPTASAPTPDNKVGLWWYGNVSLTYTSPMGDKQTFGHFTWYGTPYDSFDDEAVNRCNTDHRISSWVMPQGVTLSFTYGTGTQGGDRGRLLSVSNGLGRSLSFTYVGEDSSQMSVTAGGGDNRSVTITSAETTRADGTKMKYEYSTPTALFYAATADWSSARPMPWPHMTKVYAASDQTNAHLVIAYDEAWKVKTVTDKNSNVWAFRISGHRGALVDPLGNESASYFDGDGYKVRAVSPLGDITTTAYNGIGLPVDERTFIPGGGICTNDSEYDSRSMTEYHTGSSTAPGWWQPIKQKQFPAECIDPNPTDPDDLLITSTIYLSNYPLPVTETDPKGNDTDYTYTSKTYGGASTKQLTAIDGAEGERTEFVYGAAGNGRPTQKKTKVGTSTWMIVDYIWTGVNLTGRTIDPSGVNATTSFAYDSVGNATSVTDPNSNVTTIAYDTMRRVTTVTRPLNSKTQIKYDADGKVTKVCDALVASPGDCITNASNWAATAYTYTDTFKVESVTDPDGIVTDYNYTDRDEVEFVTRWLDVSKTSGRIEKTEYDAAGQVIKIHRAWGTALQQVYREASYFGASGLVDWVEDANDNRTGYAYDAFGRLQETCFPSKTTSGTISTTDCETYGYDNNGNMTSKVTRRGYNGGGTPTETISFVYDDSNRLTSRVVPAPGGTRTYGFAYDLAGRRTQASVESYYQDYVYDGAGRPISQTYRHSTTTSGKEATVAYEYDAAGNRTKLTWPDAFYASYVYDALNRATRLCENITNAACASAGTPTATVTYDKLSRRTALSYGNGTSASYAYTDRGDMTDLDWDLSGTAADFSYDFTYNGVGQLTSQSLNDSLLKWSPAANDNDSYTPNGLNQYADIDGATPVYDGNGNITTDHHGRGLEYDAENMLAVVRDAPAGTALLSVSPWADGTMRLSDAGGTVSRYYYDSDQEIAETDDVGGVDLADNQILWRYLRLPGAVDEVVKVISYNSNGTTASQKFAHADRLGSTRRLSWASSGNPSGADVYQYSPYGESGPEGDTGFAFRFTGQKLFSSVGLYYYKARWYDPETGRFMQTDPIGYQDQMNLYTYVGNDPVNIMDPTGMCTVPHPAVVGACVGGIIGGVTQGYKSFSAYSRGEISWQTALLQTGGGALKGAAIGFVGGGFAAGATSRLGAWGATVAAGALGGYFNCLGSGSGNCAESAIWGGLAGAVFGIGSAGSFGQPGAATTRAMVNAIVGYVGSVRDIIGSANAAGLGSSERYGVTMTPNGDGTYTMGPLVPCSSAGASCSDSSLSDQGYYRDRDGDVRNNNDNSDLIADYDDWIRCGGVCL